MVRGQAHKLAAGQIVRQGMLDDERRKGGEILWPGRAHPAHDGVRVAGEVLEAARSKGVQGMRPS